MLSTQPQLRSQNRSEGPERTDRVTTTTELNAPRPTYRC